jgi:hypothetical protein
MGRQCTVCEHPQRKAIEKLLVDPSSSNRRVAAQHGLAEASVRRHKSDHMPILLTQVAGSIPTQSTQQAAQTDAGPEAAATPQVQAAGPTPTAPNLRGLHTRRDVEHADRLVEEVKGLQARALTALGNAELTEDWKAVAGLIGQARGCLELQAKLLGKLGPQVQVNLLQAPPVVDFAVAAATFLEALCPEHAEVVDAWLAAVDKDVDGARSDPAGWLERRRAVVTVEPER